MVDLNYQASTCECSHLIDSLKNREMFDDVWHTNTMELVRANIKEEKVVKANKITNRAKNKMKIFDARKLDYLREKGTRKWLAATPNNLCGTVVSVVEFRDELRDRYGFGVLNTPSHCNGCGSKFSITRALSCKRVAWSVLDMMKVVIHSDTSHVLDSNHLLFVTNLK